jgi:hypothetical protein
MPALKPLLIIIAIAMLAGWSVHRDSPQGLLRETLEGCLSISHGFTSIYLAILGVAAGMAVVVALSAVIGSELGIFASRRAGLRGLARSSGVFAAGLAVAALLYWPIENTLPLEPPPPGACRRA